MDIAGKVALVTGAAIRVGRETATELARAGADLLVHYRTSAAEAEQLAETIRGMGRRAVTVQADFANPAEAADRLLRAIDEQFGGRCDILVNNASAYVAGSPNSLAADQWAYLVTVNVTAPTMLAERIGKRMVDAGGKEGSREGGGAIVNMLDLQARRPWPRHLGGGMAAGAMWTATIGLARKLAPAVRVNGVAPGAVLWNPADGEELRQRIIEQTPLHRLGSPRDVAKAVRFLVESDYITGQVLCVDGGRSMG
jgi:pteridine reductase